MKHSIKKIFRNLSLFIGLISIFVIASFLVTLDEEKFHNKIDILNTQKSIVLDIINLKNDAVELMIIELNGKNKQLEIEIQRLYTLYSYNFIEIYLLSNSSEYIADLDELASLRASFAQEALNYYENGYKTKIEFEKRASLLKAKIDSIISKAVTYNRAKFHIYMQISLVLLTTVLAGFIWYRRRLSLIYRDLESLFHINPKEHTIFSEEVAAISVRVNKKTQVINDQTMIDPVTELNNLNGMIRSYDEKKMMKSENFTSISIIEVDNFSITNRAYSQETTQAILKKIAYTLSLHEQTADVIARTDYNQFTVILSRPNREDSFTEVDHIRQDISELKINSQELSDTKITISGGCIIKPNNISLEEGIIQAKKVLKHAQKSGKNRISQIKDVAESEL